MSRRFSDEDVIEMRERWRRGESVGAICDRFMVSRNNAAALIFGESYADVACPVTIFERAKRNAARGWHMPGKRPRYPRIPQSFQSDERRTA